MHGFPKVMGVLTHLDSFTEQAKLKKTKKKLKVCGWGGWWQWPSGFIEGSGHRRGVQGRGYFEE